MLFQVPCCRMKYSYTKNRGVHNGSIPLTKIFFNENPTVLVLPTVLARCCRCSRTRCWVLPCRWWRSQHRSSRPRHCLVWWWCQHSPVDPAELLESHWTKATGRTLKSGTPGFQAPEQLTGLSADPTKCDVYAMGGVVVEVLSAKPIWQGMTHFQIMYKVTVEKAFPDFSNIMPTAFQPIMRKCFSVSGEWFSSTELLVKVAEAMADCWPFLYLHFHSFSESLSFLLLLCGTSLQWLNVLHHFNTVKVVSLTSCF